SAHRVTGVAPFILPPPIRDQCLRALQLDFEGGNQRIFRVHNDVVRLIFQLKTDHKLQLRSSLSSLNHCPCNSIVAHSITSLALASRCGGILMLIAFAALMLITSSNVVGCMTAKSAGLVPLRILPM